MMVKGPFGGPRPFALDTKNVIVLAGLTDPEPPRDIQLDLQTLMEDRINRSFGLNLGTLDVSLTTKSPPFPEQVDVFGDTILHVQQYDVETPWKEITSEKISNIEREVREHLRETNFNIVSTQTTVV